METNTAHQIIDGYLSQMKTDSDRLTQFYQACKIAKMALNRVDAMQNVGSLTHPSAMSPAAFKSMVSRNNMTPESVEALRGSLERGKKNGK